MTKLTAATPQQAVRMGRKAMATWLSRPLVDLALRCLALVMCIWSPR
ncbi:hypothetical protein [Roseibium salinum]|uniref:Uncharacterized protein n=1 Tax=Roseibium salinum TaxID=1604349 RepID=A0ABT3QWN2_9HYPH|nr:hypothetical protein [Roseibium sp. DSM 29163]MCX2721353.1 hypothetical protein [Roseibium sp. DSM 29163]